MGKATGFKEYKREALKRDPVEDRVKHYGEFDLGLKKHKIEKLDNRCFIGHLLKTLNVNIIPV